MLRVYLNIGECETVGELERSAKAVPWVVDLLKKQSKEGIVEAVDSIRVHKRFKVNDYDAANLKRQLCIVLCVMKLREHFAKCHIVGVLGSSFAGKSTMVKEMLREDMRSSEGFEEKANMQQSIAENLKHFVCGAKRENRTREVKMWRILRNVESDRKVYLVDFPGGDSLATFGMDGLFLLDCAIVVLNARAGSDLTADQKAMVENAVKFAPNVMILLNKLDELIRKDWRVENDTMTEESCDCALKEFKHGLFHHATQKHARFSSLTVLFSISIPFNCSAPNEWIATHESIVRPVQLYERIKKKFVCL